MSERRGFSFHVGGIEDAIVAALEAYCESYKPDVSTYGGELDAKNLREALSQLQSRFPLFLVSYGDGEDIFRSPLGPEVGAPREYLHKCSFTVICVSDNARGEEERRRGATGDVGVYDMIEDAQTALWRMQFVAVLGDGEKIILNPDPLDPAGVEYIAHLPELTAYAVHFETGFIYATPDRRKPGNQVQQIEIEIFPLSGRYSGQKPGVVVNT